MPQTGRSADPVAAVMQHNSFGSIARRRRFPGSAASTRPRSWIWKRIGRNSGPCAGEIHRHVGLLSKVSTSFPSWGNTAMPTLGVHDHGVTGRCMVRPGFSRIRIATGGGISPLLISPTAR